MVDSEQRERLQAREDQILGYEARSMATLVECADAKQQIMQWFNKWDLNGDGMISKPELERVLRAVNMDVKQVDEMMRLADTNGDGKIQYAEFINWIWQAPTEIAAPVYCQTKTVDDALVDFMDFISELMDDKEKSCKLRKIFDTMDLNNNGKISISEFLSGARSLGYRGEMCTEAMLKEIFQEVDLEKKVAGKMQKDRLLSYSEFTKAFKKTKQQMNHPSAGA